MAQPLSRTERVAVAIVVGVIASVIAALALAPLVTVGWCYDAAEGGTSWCGREQRSLLGVPSPWWLWLIAQALIVVVTVRVARSRRRGPGLEAHVD